MGFSVQHRLPELAKRLCVELKAPPRLVAHLTLVHDAACELVQGLEDRFPGFHFDHGAVLFGASSHDLGKILHPAELSGPGHRHEDDGPTLLEPHGVPPHLTRIARTHATWDREPVEIEDLLVALADKVWKGQRNEILEGVIVDRIASATGITKWEVFSRIDEILASIAEKGGE
jgi:HD domain